MPVDCDWLQQSGIIPAGRLCLDSAVRKYTCRYIVIGFSSQEAYLPVDCDWSQQSGIIPAGRL